MREVKRGGGGGLYGRRTAGGGGAWLCGSSSSEAVLVFLARVALQWQPNIDGCFMVESMQNISLDRGEIRGECRIVVSRLSLRLVVKLPSLLYRECRNLVRIYPE